MTTRKLCASPRCEGVGYFVQRQEWETVCDQCIAKAHDLASAEISQDNGEVSNFLAPIDAMSLARARIELAVTLKQMHRWKTLALSHHTRLIAISQTKMLGKPQKIAADGVDLFYTDFEDLAEDIEGRKDKVG